MGLQNLQIACQAKLSDFGFAQRCLRGMFRGLQAGLPLGFMTLLHDLIGYIIAFPRYSLSFFFWDSGYIYISSGKLTVCY